MTTYNGRVEGILLRGLTVEDIRKNSTIADHVITGDLKSITAGSGRIAIGSRLAESLGAEVGSQITIVNPAGRSTPFGSMPRMVSYTVGAIFEIGVYDYDKAYVVMPMEDAQTLLLLDPDTVGMIEVKTVDPDKVGSILAPLVDKVAGRAQISDWRQMNAQLFEALGIEQVSMFVILSIIILVAAFNISSSLIMLVRAKTRDIAILRTMGASRGALVRIFMTVGTTIGALADRRFRSAPVGPEAVGPDSAIPNRIAVEARHGGNHVGGADRAVAQFPCDALSGAKGCQHRPSSSATL